MPGYLACNRMIRSIFRPVPSGFNWACYGYFKKAATVTRGNYATDQLSYIQSEIENNHFDWTMIKNHILSMQGSINNKNIDAVFLKVMVKNKKFDAAMSFADHLKKSCEELSIGSINGLLTLYFEVAKERKLSESQKVFILDTYTNLYKKYKVLDFTTCERLLHALCAIDEWKKAIRVLKDLHLSSTPSHSAYSTLIATLFKNNKNIEAMKLIEESANYNRPLLNNAYEAWINYILCKYKDKKTIFKHMEGICSYISNYWISVSIYTAERFEKLYRSAGWDVQFTQIRKVDGQCMCCREKLNPLHLTDEEFQKLHSNIQEKLIVGSDLFLKTSPKELKRFLDFIEETAPYDVVLDALNIAFAARGGVDKFKLLNFAVNYFSQKNKRILLLGRKHMLSWNRKHLQQLVGKTCSFFTDDLSQDDPYFITAAILSGPHTDIVSKDLLRGHRFLLQDNELKVIFKKWQWQHQYMVFTRKNGKILMQEPLQFNPYAQKNNNSWHIPYENEQDVSDYVNDGTPDLSSWLCLRPKSVT